MILPDGGLLKERAPGWVYRHYQDSDGWRGWMFKDGRYYFSDVPESRLGNTEKYFYETTKEATDKIEYENQRKLNQTTGGK
jgi:hypothetical protein